MPIRLRNISPLGWIDVPELGREGDAPAYVCQKPDACHDEHEHTELVDPGHAKGTGPIAPGEEFEAPTELAESLLEQVDNFQRATAKPPTTQKEG